MIDLDTTITAVSPETLDIHPRLDHCHLQPVFEGHSFFLRFEACGLSYGICGRCGTVRISEQHAPASEKP
jgi:hypothetical protein